MQNNHPPEIQHLIDGPDEPQLPEHASSDFSPPPSPKSSRLTLLLSILAILGLLGTAYFGHFFFTNTQNSPSIFDSKLEDIQEETIPEENIVTSEFTLPTPNPSLSWEK